MTAHSRWQNNLSVQSLLPQRCVCSNLNTYTSLWLDNHKRRLGKGDKTKHAQRTWPDKQTAGLQRYKCRNSSHAPPQAVQYISWKQHAEHFILQNKHEDNHIMIQVIQCSSFNNFAKRENPKHSLIESTHKTTWQQRHSAHGDCSASLCGP